MHLRHQLVLATLAFLTPIPGQAQPAIVWLEGDRPDALTLRAVDERTLQPPGRTILRDLAPLPIETSRRTTQQSLRRDLPKLRPAGVPRLELPGNGCIVRYRRANTRFGFFWVRTDGLVVVLHELAALATGSDPFLDRLGVADDGRHVVMADQRAGLHIARLDGGTFGSTGTARRSLAVGQPIEAESLCVGSTHMFFQTADGHLWRCGLADGRSPTRVTPAGAPGSEFEEEMALSGDGQRLVFLFGPKRAQSLYLLGTAGPAIRLPPPPSKYEEPGYLPAVRGGPHLLLDHTGSRLFYSDHSNREEHFLLELGTTSRNVHLSSDANLQPYIDVDIFPSFAATNLVVGLGDPARIDWFRGRVTHPRIDNITRTGSNAAPFAAGRLDPSGAFPLGAGTRYLLVTERTPTGESVRRVDAIGNQHGIVDSAIRTPPELGSSLTRDAHILVRSHHGDLLLRGTDGTAWLRAPTGVSLSAPVRGLGITLSVVRAGPHAALLFGNPSTLGMTAPIAGLRRASLTTEWGLVLDSAQLDYVSQARRGTLSTRPFRFVLSGAGS